MIVDGLLAIVSSAYAFLVDVLPVPDFGPSIVRFTQTARDALSNMPFAQYVPWTVVRIALGLVLSAYSSALVITVFARVFAWVRSRGAAST